MPAARRVALVTGSSRGLGRAIANRLAVDGLAVAVNDAHGGERAAAVAAAITEEGGVAATFGADLTNEAQVRRMVEAVEAALGPVDVLVVTTGRHQDLPEPLRQVRGALPPLRLIEGRPHLSAVA